MDSNETENEKVFIIPGASSGIGRALALELARHPGHALCLAARDREALEQLRLECDELKAARAMIQVTDVGREKDCERLIRNTVSEFGRIDVLVNNAGISMKSRFDEIESLSTFSRLMEVNYMGAVQCTHFALPALKNSRGLVVGISSWQGKVGFPGSTGYSASKFALQGFLDSLRIELREFGVGVLVVSPGPVATRIHGQKLDSRGKMSTRGGSVGAKGIMPADECARLTARAILRRKRELILTAKGKALPWMRLFAPKTLDTMIEKGVREFYGE